MDNSGRSLTATAPNRDDAPMNTTWTVGVLSAGSETVRHLAGGIATTRSGAVDAASDALMMAAMDRGRQEYRIALADTHVVLTPGLTERGDVDLVDLVDALRDMERHRP